MIAEDILRPGKLARLGRYFELGFEHLLIVIVAWAQHHAVLAECDRLLIVICREVSDGENRHCGSTRMLVPMACIFRAKSRADLYHAVADSTRTSIDQRDARSPVGGRRVGVGLVYCHVVGWRTSTAPTASRPDGDISAAYAWRPTINVGRARGRLSRPRGYERRIGSERLADFKKTVEALVASASTTRRLAGSPPRRHAERRRVAQAGGALDALLPQRPHAFAESQRRPDPHRRCGP
jgi:hypothetical protein